MVELFDGVIPISILSAGNNLNEDVDNNVCNFGESSERIDSSVGTIDWIQIMEVGLFPFSIVKGLCQDF